MLIIRKEAEEDIRAGYEWYEKKQAGLGISFIEEVESKLQIIEEQSSLYTEVMDDVRRALCNRFPYSIYFINKNMDVVVIAVLHQRRSPAVWQERKRAEQGA